MSRTNFLLQHRVYEDESTFSPEKGIELEVRAYYRYDNKPRIVFATGLGGCAGRNSLVDGLVDDFQVVTFSPRNSGNSNGRLGVENYISDLKHLIEEQSYLSGAKAFGIGHSFGGYCLARLLEEERVVDRAVLLSPLTELAEQNPYLVDKLLRIGSRNNYVARIIGFCSSFLNGFNGARIDKQRFDLDVQRFLRGLYDSKKINQELKSPTQVFLAGRTNCRLRIPDLDELKKYWESLGANVETYPEINHWFSGKGFSGVGDGFSLCKNVGITSKIRNFLTNSAS